MGQRQHRDLGQTQEEDLQVLNNRLCSSTYEEDKIETLESIHAHSLQMPVTVGTICLQSVFKSLESMDSCEYQLRIIRNVLSGDLRSEFTEMLFGDDSNVDILLGLRIDKIARLSSVFRSEYYFNRLSRAGPCTKIIFALVEHNFLENVRYFVSQNRDLKERLVFEGMLEVLVEKMKNRDMPPNARHALETLILALLSDSVVNQDYFMGLEPCRMHFFTERDSGSFASSVFSVLLNPLNDRFLEIQRRLFTPKLIHRAVEKKQYGFLNRLVLNNAANTGALVDRYINREILVEDAEKDGDAFQLFSSCAALLDAGSIHSDSYRVNLVLEQTGHSGDLKLKVLRELESGCITEDMLLYILFSFDSVRDIAGHLRIERLDGVRYDICLMLFLVHDIPLPLNHSQAVDRLRSFRMFLCSNVLLTDFFTEMLIANIGDLIKERTDRLLEETRRALTPGTTAAPNQVTLLDTERVADPSKTAGFKKLYDFAHIKETGYRKINDALSLFKTEGKKQDTYDL